MPTPAIVSACSAVDCRQPIGRCTSTPNELTIACSDAQREHKQDVRNPRAPRRQARYLQKDPNDRCCSRSRLILALGRWRPFIGARGVRLLLLAGLAMPGDRRSETRICATCGALERRRAHARGMLRLIFQPPVARERAQIRRDLEYRRAGGGRRRGFLLPSARTRACDPGQT